MPLVTWRRLSLIERIRWLRYMLPPALVTIVVIYQLGVAQTLAQDYGHIVHYGVEIAFYSLVGPMVTWVTLVWVERRLSEQERLERQVQVHTQQLASLTAVSADAILSLDSQGYIASWNRGAERIFGYSEAAILGHPLSLLLPKESHLQRQGTVQNYETTARAKDGRSITVDLSQTQLAVTDEDMPVSLIIMRDATTRRERAAILEEERARIARDLHDGVAQTLYFLALKADMARQQMTQYPDRVIAELREMGQTTRQVIRDVRRTIFALHSPNWSSDGFLSALRRFVDGFAEQVGWQVTMEIGSLLDIPSRLEPTIFRLVQESLNNVAKHAEATHVWIDLHLEEASGSVILTVRDNGHGFDPSTSAHNGLGLNQIETRITTFGGVFLLNSRIGEGTTITAKLPGETYA